MTPFEHAVLAYCYVNHSGMESETLRHVQVAHAAHPDDVELNKLLRLAQFNFENTQLLVV